MQSRSAVRRLRGCRRAYSRSPPGTGRSAARARRSYPTVRRSRSAGKRCRSATLRSCARSQRCRPDANRDDRGWDCAARKGVARAPRRGSRRASSRFVSEDAPERPVFVHEKVHDHRRDRGDEPILVAVPDERRHQVTDDQRHDERRRRDGDEGNPFAQRVAARAERPNAVEEIIPNASGQESDRIDDVVPADPFADGERVLDRREDDEVHEESRRSHDTELDELTDSAASRKALEDRLNRRTRIGGRTHATQYQSAKRTVKSPSRGSENATIALLTE